MMSIGQSEMERDAVQVKDLKQQQNQQEINKGNRLPREAGESPSLEVYKSHGDVPFGAWFRGGHGNAGLITGLDLKGLFHPKQF